MLSALLMQFYEEVPPPRNVLVDRELPEAALLAEAMTGRAGHRVALSVPQRGDRRRLMEQARRNAAEALDRRMAEGATQTRLLAEIADLFELPEPPERIEVYDNSHIQGTSALGAMVVAGPEGLRKNQYRKFNIKRAETVPGDDFAMMREVFERRFARAQVEDPDRQGGTWPDLVLIDGGQGQLNAARAVLADLGIADLCIAGVAKGPDRDAGREHFYVPEKPSFMIEARDPVLYYIQRLRDEAHRFAIGSHRAKRAKAIALNPLDEIAGIGPTRKKALLQAFGSAKAVARASLADLAKVEGVNYALAQAIYDHFHEGGP